MEKQRLVPGDPVLIENIVNYLKAKGIFDEFRHECLADVDTKSSCQNLSQRVDGYTTKFLSGEKWHPDLNKNELRNKLRRHIDESGMLAGGADHVVEQVINPKINQLFLPRIIEVVHQYLNEENEKLNKRKESSNDNASSEKTSVENTDGANKTKSTKLDPIADILSFSYSKPQTNLQQNVQTKVIDASKTERKKDENLLQLKLSDALPKTDKKKEEPTIPVKVSEVILKIKKEDSVSDAAQNIEKDKEEGVSVKMESIEPATELPSPVPALQTKSLSDSKEPMKIKKEKIEESETPSDPLKKTAKEDIKPEKKKGELEKKKDDSEKKKDDFKTSSDLSSHSEEGGQSKAVPSALKSSNVVKNKSESEKSKKVKLHSSSKTSNESQKSKTKDSEKVSSKSSEKHKTSSKVLKPSLKDHPSPHKSGGTSKSSKSDKTEDSKKNKSKDGHPKPSSSVKKENSSIKSKTSSDKTKTSKSSDLKPNIKTQTESSEKTGKTSLQYSSYDSSQGSDQDKSSTSSSHREEKPKHFSKHHKKESNNKKSSDKLEKTPDKKRFQSDSDSGTPVKHKHMKHASEKEKKKSMKIQESAKISSRSNSFGSTSSVSDSPSSSSKETSASTSEETSDTSSKSSEAKKKQDIKDKERCKRNKDFPPPPPPPPTSGISAPGSSSAEVSSMDETQSSQESESDSKVGEDESSSESDVENLYSSNSLKNSSLESGLKTPEILNDVFDVFLYSSSSSEFEGYSSTSNSEMVQANMKQVYDVDVSSVHTSDLSSFDDLLSESDYSNSDVDEDRPARRLTLKEAKKLLEAKAKQRRLERSKNAVQSKHLLDDKNSITSPQVFTSALLSEEESSPAPVEPKRESRRERKLNPKYASSEYASIFNSKKTSFITKQTNSSDDRLENVSPTASESDIRRQKDISPPKRRVSMGNLEANQLPNQDAKNSSCAAATLQTFEFSDNAKRKLSFESAEESVWTSETKTYFNSHERNISMILDDSESHASIALKIKKSVIKNDNEINREPRPQGLKRKLDRNEKGDAKKLCRRNSDNSSSSESVPNENNPFNVKANNPSSVFNMEPKNKDFFHLQKISNNGVVLKIEHVKKKSLPKPNHVVEKQSSD